MLRCVAGAEKLRGKTIVLVDVSGSMTAPLSERSEMQRTDAAYGLAVLLREIGERVAVFSFSDKLVEVPARRGFALRDAIDHSQPHSSTRLGQAVTELNDKHSYDRLIVITDEQSHDRVPAPCPERLRRAQEKTKGPGSPDSPLLTGWGGGYVINVASYKNGIGYGPWTHIDGWSESVVEYIRELERAEE